jgi:hypothetical protein
MFKIRLFYESAGLGMQPVLLCPRRNHFAPMHGRVNGNYRDVSCYYINGHNALCQQCCPIVLSDYFCIEVYRYRLLTRGSDSFESIPFRRFELPCRFINQFGDIKQFHVMPPPSHDLDTDGQPFL